MPYRITDEFSTADIGLIVFGESVEKIFIDAAYGLMEIISNRENFEKTKSLKIIIEADSLEDLLYHWLSDIIYHKDGDELSQIVGMGANAIVENLKQNLK